MQTLVAFSRVEETTIYLVQPMDGDVDDPGGFFEVCREQNLSVKNVGWVLGDGLGDLIEEANALGGYPEPWRGPVVFAELRLRSPCDGGARGGIRPPKL